MTRDYLRCYWCDGDADPCDMCLGTGLDPDVVDVKRWREAKQQFDKDCESSMCNWEEEIDGVHHFLGRAEFNLSGFTGKRLSIDGFLLPQQ